MTNKKLTPCKFASASMRNTAPPATAAHIAPGPASTLRLHDASSGAFPENVSTFLNLRSVYRPPLTDWRRLSA